MGGVPTTVEHDMQGDEVAISPVGMGAPRVAPVLFGGDLCEDAQHHYECFASGSISGHQREVLLFPLFLPWVETDPCPMKVHEGISRTDCVYPPSVRQMPGVLPKPPHVIDSMRGRLLYGPTREGAQGCRAPPD